MMYKKNNSFKVFFALFLSLVFASFLFSFSSLALASDNFGSNFIESEINLSKKDPRAIATQIINIALSILGIVAVSIVIFAGFIWMTAEGNEEKISKAKGILKAGIIGLLIVLSAWGIASFVLRQLGDATGVSVNTCIDGDQEFCGCEGVSVCSNSSWGPCIGSTCLPGGHGSSCNKPENPLACSSATLCNFSLICGDTCTCIYPGEGDSCGQIENGVCSAVDSDCNSNLFCSPESCTCQYQESDDDDYSELGDPCYDGSSCSSENNICNPSHGLSCNSNTCSCEGNPVITGFSPLGGFCDNLPNTPCNDNSSCNGGACNLTDPNISSGNLLTIFGYNFDDYDPSNSVVNFISGGDTISALVPGDLNPACGSSWSPNQIIAVMPNNNPFNNGDNLEVEVKTKTNKSDRSRDNSGPVLDPVLFNSILRPGLCGISTTTAVTNQDITYFGLNLSNSRAYFGNYTNNSPGLSPSNFDDDLQGFTKVPNIASGDTSTFAKKSMVSSNFLDFKKLPEAPQGPSISFFDPLSGPSGQYVSIHGSGFNNFKVNSSVFLESQSGDSYEASFNFPDVCLHSSWSNSRIIFKIPENIPNGSYNVAIKIGNWPRVVANSQITVDQAIPLDPGLCKISPLSGSASSIVSFWGEYFYSNASNTRAVFSNNKISNSLNVISEQGADKVSSAVVQNAVTGPVFISRDSINNGNSLNFKIGLCSNSSDCDGGICCLPGTHLEFNCVSDINDCNASTSPSSVFEWKFTTGFGTSTPTTNDGGEAYSCSSYNFCPTSAWVCPNSPGLCSPYNGGNPVEVANCRKDCSEFSFCGVDGSDCTYNDTLDKCVLNSANCSIDRVIQYNLGLGVSTTTANAICKKHIINGVEKTFYEISVPGSCPSGWTMVPGGKCIDISDGCSLCPNGSTCYEESSSNGICISNKLCPLNTICSNDKCIKEDNASCQCCCDKNQNTPLSGGTNPACCAPLTCDNTCGVSANPNPAITNFGLCSGCNIAGLSTSQKDLACNCSGIYGKYCDTSYSSGACLDCTALSETSCREHESTCCWNGSVCRGGVSDASVWSSSNNYGLCPSYNCDSVNQTICASTTPIIGGVYDKVSTCEVECPKNCNQYNDFNSCGSDDSCCWSGNVSSGVCTSGIAFDSGANVGLCKKFSCTTSTGLCSEGLTGNFFSQQACDLYCAAAPSGFGNSCSSVATTTCNTGSCSFDCLLDSGYLGDSSNNGLNCGTCCCKPNSDKVCSLNSTISCSDSSPCPTNSGSCVDNCGLINERLNCVADKGLCSGPNRGLCCGCSSDSDCVSASSSPEFVGCALDSCCKARPEIQIDINKPGGLDVSPYHRESNVCRNTVIEINFDQKMDVMSFSDNIILLEESDEPCSSGTYFIGGIDNENNFFAKIKSIISKVFYKISKIINNKALASGPLGNKIYCAVLGSVEPINLSSTKTSVYFKPNSLLKAGKRYFVVVKGDKDLNSFSGVKSIFGISMNGKGYYSSSPANTWIESDESLPGIKFNNVVYKNSYIWHFETLESNSSNQGICTIDYVNVSPSSYLFNVSSNDLSENDNDSNHESFDSARDKDKVYFARAYSASGQILNQSSQYNWTWGWELSNSNILEFNNNVVSWTDNGSRRLVQVKTGVNSGQSSVKAQVLINPSSNTMEGNNKQKTVPAYVMICNNPWPAFNDVSNTWFPWRDNASFGQYNYEFYYCRDSGSPESGDDLPAFISDLAVTKGNSMIKVCSNAPSQICSNNSQCPSGGLCMVSFFKETYFFKERVPRFINDLTVSDNGTGSSLYIQWTSDAQLVNKYKLYYSDPNLGNVQTILLDPDNDCSESGGTYSCFYNLNNLVNNQQYAIRITAISENLAETNFSLIALGTPTESQLSNVPSNLQAEVLADKIVKLSWTAPAATVNKYKVYRGVVSGVFGSSFLTNNNETSVTIDLSSAPSNIYYFAISSIVASGNEGSRSSELMINLNEIGSYFVCGDNFTDTRDSNVYPTVQIGAQCWLAKNLAYLPNVHGPSTGWNSTEPRYAVYNYSSSNNSVAEAKATDNYINYGALYNWPAVMQNSGIGGGTGICPEGWRVPSDSEWTTITDYLGGLSVAGGKMKQTGTTLWNSPNTGATNESGFTALPAGLRRNDGLFLELRGNAYFWSSSLLSGHGLTHFIGSSNSIVTRGIGAKSYGFSVRCLRN